MTSPPAASESVNAPEARPYAHLLRRRRKVDMWLLAMLVRQMHLQSELSNQKHLHAWVSKELGLEDLSFAQPLQLQAITRRLQSTYKVMRQRSSEFRLPAVLRANLAVLARQMGLSDAEQKVLALAILFRSNHSLFTVAHATYHSVNVVQQIAYVVGTSARSLRSAIAPEGLLRRAGLLSISSGESLGSNLRLQSQCFRRLAIEQFSQFDEMLGGVAKKSPPSRIASDAYSHLRPSFEAIAAMLDDAIKLKRKGVNVLLYGVAGTGKTELARLLAGELRIQSFEVSSSEPEGAPLDPKQRLNCAATAQIMLMNLKAILVFDEIDAAFTDGSQLFGKPATAESAKCWVNDLLENNPVPTVWIANRVGGMDPAFIRRFDLVVHVDTAPESARRKLLQEQCVFLESAQLQRLARATLITPALITRAACVTGRLGPKVGDQRALFETVLDGVLKAQGLPSVDQQCRGSLDDAYDLALCNSDVDLASICDGLMRRPTGRIFLYGPAGTGKSAFGRWLSRQLDRPLLIKRFSEIQSPWLGEMERNLAKVFEQATRDGSVLQFDEVDSYLQDRRIAQRSWEISQVNEFLTQLECFEGVFVATTNLMGQLDPAAMRRFDFKVKLGFLTHQQVCTCLIATLPGMGMPPICDAQIRSSTIALDQLTPGDFAILARQHRICPYSGVSEIIDALRKEQALKEPKLHRVGFV